MNERETRDPWLRRLWVRLLGRPTLRPRLTAADWATQDHAPVDGSRLHYPGDNCPLADPEPPPWPLDAARAGDERLREDDAGWLMAFNQRTWENEVDALIDELRESPLPGARYAVAVVRRRFGRDPDAALRATDTEAD